MKQFTLMAALAVALITGIASADPASRIAAFNKATGGTNLLAVNFGGPTDATTNAIKELVAAGWTDEAVIAASSKTLNGASITWALKVDKATMMTQEFCDKFLAYCENDALLGSKVAAQLKAYVPFDQRPKFKALYEVAAKDWMLFTYPGVPLQTARLKLLVEKSIAMQDEGTTLFDNLVRIDTLKSATIEELIALRLAPELRVSDEATLILEKATAGAKKQLRVEGKSFVTYTEVVGGVTNVVNPLTAKLAPVVEAINAPLMTGLEGALATCGISIPSQNANRAAMSALSDGWKNAILDGEVAPAQQAPYLAALKVSLGVVEYNNLVNTYNGVK